MPPARHYSLSALKIKYFKTPHAIAVSCQDAKLTYQDLSHRSNQVAHFLQQRGIGADMRIGLCLERCPEMIVALLGILKASAAYVPLDPAYPLERLEFMMQDAEMPLLLTSAPLRNILPTTWAQVVSMDEDWAEISSCSAGTIENCVCQDNLAYLIYTSGSTGQPKGSGCDPWRTRKLSAMGRRKLRV